MRLALFTDTFSPEINGVAKTLERFTDYLESCHIPHKIVTPAIQEGVNMDKHYSIASMPFFLYPECRLAVPNPVSLKNELNRFQPDIIHAATPFSTGLCGLQYGKKKNIPLVSSYHTHFDRYLRYYKLEFLAPILMKYLEWFHNSFDQTFVPSKETQNILDDFGFQRLAIWSRGVDCNQFTPEKRHFSTREKYRIKKKFMFLFVGRLSPEKDLDLLKDIIQKLPPTLKENVHWVIAGDGPLYKELDQWKEDSVTLTGYLMGEELASLYASADLFVFPSCSETFGNVVLEAMASGVPAIVSDSGGVTEIVEHMKTGMICKSHDVSSFHLAIERILKNPSLLAAMKNEARWYATTQSWTEIFGRLIANYERIIFYKNKHVHSA